MNTNQPNDESRFTDLFTGVFDLIGTAGVEGMFELIGTLVSAILDGG